MLWTLAIRDALCPTKMFYNYIWWISLSINWYITFWCPKRSFVIYSFNLTPVLRYMYIARLFGQQEDDLSETRGSLLVKTMWQAVFLVHVARVLANVYVVIKRQVIVTCQDAVSQFLFAVVHTFLITCINTWNIYQYYHYHTVNINVFNNKYNNTYNNIK